MALSSISPAAAGVLVLVCFFGFLSRSEANNTKTSSIAFAGITPAAGVFPQHSSNAATAEVEMKPDLATTKFSAQSAVFFSKLSSIAYSPQKTVRDLVKGNSTSEGMGFDRFHWFEAGEEAKMSLFDAIHDTEAFVAANDDMVVVVFRGTMEKADWVTDLNPARRDLPGNWGPEAGAVHEGFDDGVSTVWDSRGNMRRVVKDLCGEANKNRKLYITGHSLGGALATVTAARLAFEDNLDIAGVYTIGSPTVYESTAAAKFDSKMNYGTKMKDKYFRVKNNNDIVPTFKAGLTHVGTEIYIDRFGTISTSSFLDGLLGRLSSLFRGELTDGANDHATSEYVRHLKHAVINGRVSLGEKARSTLSDAVGGLVLKVAPDSVVEKSETLTKLKEVKAVVQEVKEAAKATAAKGDRVEL